jgi:hypothetical protein
MSLGREAGHDVQIDGWRLGPWRIRRTHIHSEDCLERWNGRFGWRWWQGRRKLGQRRPRLGGEGFDFRSGFVQDGADLASRAQHGVTSGFSACVISRLQCLVIGDLDRRVKLSREYEKFPPGLDHDAPHVPARGGHDVERFALGGLAYLVAKTRQLVRLVQPGLTALLVFVEKVRDTRWKR